MTHFGLPDIEPGKALQVMARLATKVAATTEASAQFIAKEKLVVTGYPVREAFEGATREQGRARFNIGQNEKVLLVFGGSKGARSINRAILKDIGSLLRLGVVIHVSGAADWAEVSAARAQLTGNSRRVTWRLSICTRRWPMQWRQQI